MERIGVYCGIFNPPHMGHVRAAQAAVEELKLDKLLLIPDRVPPHRELPPGACSMEQRLRMLQLCSDDPGIAAYDPCLSDSAPSYTWQILEQVRRDYPDGTLYLLLGADRFLTVLNWEGADRILSAATLAVLCRDQGKLADAVTAQIRAVKAAGGHAVRVQNPVTDLSSTQVRRLLAFGCGDECLPGAVAAYIRENRLYDTAADWKNLPMEELERVVISLLNPNRVAHVLGCRDTAVELAKRWGADVTDAARAGLLHDVTKALDGPLQLTLCQHYGKILSDFSRKYPKTLHALTGSLVAERIFGENKAVVSAVCHHTTGKANMSLLEKIIYVADYMEPNRTVPGVNRLRALAFSDLDAALKLGLEMTLEHLNRQGSEVSPDSREALAYLNSK